MCPLTYLGRYDVHQSTLPDPRGQAADIKERDLFVRALKADRKDIPSDINRPLMILDDAIHGEQVKGFIFLIIISLSTYLQ